MFCLFSFLLYMVLFYFWGGFWLGILDFLKDFLGYFLIQRYGLRSWLSLCFWFLVNGSLAEHLRLRVAEAGGSRELRISTAASPQTLVAFSWCRPWLQMELYSISLTNFNKKTISVDFLFMFFFFFNVILSFLHLARGAYDGVVTEGNSCWRCVL